MKIKTSELTGTALDWAEDSSIAALQEWEAAWRKYITEAS